MAEKEATRALDALAARRRRVSMVTFGNGYEFVTPSGPKTLLDLFDGRDQLVVYLDRSTAMVTRLQAEHLALDARVMDAASLDFEDGSFDVVTAGLTGAAGCQGRGW